VRVTAAGLETATVINPDAASDPAMARLLVAPRVPLRAASVLPATVTGLSTGGWDPRATLDYVPAFMARMGVSSPADLLARETGIDYRSDIVPWLGNEMATATLPGGILGETVYLLSVKDEAAAASGVAKVMGVLRDRLPGLLDQLESLGEGAGVAPIELRDSGLPTTTTTINGTAVTTYPFADTVAVHAAVRNGFLYLTGSDAAMRDLLADGPRLSESPRYRATMARVPAGATGHGFSDVGGTLKAISPIMSGLLGFVLSETDEIGSAEANRLAGQVGNFLDFAAARAGVQVTWTETTNFGLRAKSFLPVKWQ
ncbi:MAG TPA: hypothetical protein VNT60_10675, partial [Deinococcales bacterium]|nr:hypothetical protein [Deinococcales bacterium]